MSATVKYAFCESRAGAGAPKRLQAGGAAGSAPERVPRVARLLALAHKFQAMLDSGEVDSMAQLAKLGRVSRARITQIMDVLLLAPDIQEQVLFGNVSMLLRELFAVVRRVRWSEQRLLFREQSSALPKKQPDCPPRWRAADLLTGSRPGRPVSPET
jgi:hypothetical protein